MRKILTSRLFRCMICLILVCSLLVLSSPIRAQAVLTEAATGFVVVGGIVCIAAIFQALGVLPGAEPIHFNDKVNECFEYIKNTTSYVVNDGFQVLGTMAALETGYLSFLPRDLLQNVLDWLYSSGTLMLSSHINSGSFNLQGQSFSVAVNAPFTLISAWYPGTTSTSFGYVFAAVSRSYSGVNVYVNGNKVSPWMSSTSYTFYNLAGSGGSLYYSNPPLTDVRTIQVSTWVQDTYKLQLENALLGTVYTSLDLTLGQIHAPIVGTDEEEITIEIAPIYVDWATGEVSQSPPGSDDDNGSSRPAIPYWPVGIPSVNYEDVINQDQQQAQSGQTGIDFESAINPDDGGTGDGSGTGTNSGSGTNTGTGSWTPPSDMGKFTLDLKQYFPFCIPFDLYAFFTCLNAEPVAPVIEWIIPLPGGKTYPFEIDLSAFDSVAQILRRMQLLLFCVGLAFKTRDLIKG